MESQGSLTISGQVYFLARSDKYITEKPYTLRYKPDGFPQTNVERSLHSLVFKSLREAPPLNYERSGFKVAKLKSAMTYEDYNDELKIEAVHQNEVAACVREALKASSVHILDYVVRRRHQSWPIATGESYSFQQPASAAHIGRQPPAHLLKFFANFPLTDHTYDAGRKMVGQVYGEKTDLFLESHKRWQCVNVWHPLRGPLVDWPLGLCDASSVDFAQDTMTGDIVDREDVFENTQVLYNSEQEWYYLPNQMPDELLIFKNADSESKLNHASPGVPHASFDNPLTTENDMRRESIELRVLVTW